MKKITAEEFIALAKEGKLGFKIIPEKKVTVEGNISLHGKYPPIVIDNYIFEGNVSFDNLICKSLYANGTIFKKLLSYENHRIERLSIQNVIITGTISMGSNRKCDI